jgi:hypothetical protein
MFNKFESIGRSEISLGMCDEEFLDVRKVGKFGRIGRSEKLGG